MVAVVTSRRPRGGGLYDMIDGCMIMLAFQRSIGGIVFCLERGFAVRLSITLDGERFVSTLYE
jgi:hypothetical protein